MSANTKGSPTAALLHQQHKVRRSRLLNLKPPPKAAPATVSRTVQPAPVAPAKPQYLNVRTLNEKMDGISDQLSSIEDRVIALEAAVLFLAKDLYAIVKEAKGGQV